MLEGGCSEEGVNDRERSPFHLCLGAKQSPSVCNRLIDRQDAALEPFRQVPIKPLLQLRAPLTGREKLDSEADFSHGKDTDVKGTGVGGLQPLFHPPVWLATAVELGEHIGIEQKAAHRSVGRP